MQTEDSVARNSPAKEELTRKSYETPRLFIHGTLEELTTGAGGANLDGFKENPGSF